MPLAHANALVHELRVGLDYSGTQRPAIIKTVSALIAWAAALEHENAALYRQLTELRAQVVAALSSAGPEVGEDERAG